jgi:D-alanine-D-alanine ligase
MRVAVLFNDDGALAHGEEKDALAVAAVTACADSVARALRGRGHDVVAIAAPEEPGELLAALRAARPDAVFNLVESLRGDATLEASVVALLELSAIPFTGNGALACALSLRKPLAKALLAASGVPVAPGCVLETGEEPLPDPRAADPALRCPFPWIVKPAREDASHGISKESVVSDAAAARARARFVIERYRQPALVERFVEGRELNVGMIGPADAPELLPVAEIDFTAFPAGRPRLVTYESKWVEGSDDWNGTPVKDAELAPPLAARIAAVARAAWRALGLRSYGRVDLRLHESEGPFVLEVNPNPDVSPDAGFARAWGRRGGAERSYDDLVATILRHARAGVA